MIYHFSGYWCVPICYCR